MTELVFRSPPQEPLTKAEIADRVAALPVPEGWSLQDDVALMEGLFKLVGLMRISVQMKKPFDAVQARFLQLRSAAVKGAGPFSLTAQAHLLDVVRGRVNEG